MTNRVRTPKKKSNGHDKNVIHNPHDKFLFSTLRNKRVAQDLMTHYLPTALLK